MTRFRISLVFDAFLGSGVPVEGDPMTAFENVPLLGLRTATILDNCQPLPGEIVKARFIATNCERRRLEIVCPGRVGRETVDQRTVTDSIVLLPGASFEYSTFHSWDAPGRRELTFAYEVRSAGHPFERLTFPKVAIHVRRPEAYAVVPEKMYLAITGADRHAPVRL